MSRTYYHRHTRKPWRYPPSWRNALFEKPFRARTRQCEKKVVKTENPDVVFPESWKAHHGYWD